jgi:hypothetical protein
MGSGTKETGPGGDFHAAMLSVQKRAREKAKAICEDKSKCCSSISISYVLQGGILELASQPNYSGWNETINCTGL